MPMAQVAVRERTFTEADVGRFVEAAFRDAYQDGVERAQLERRGRPFLDEQEALDRWLSRQSH